MIFREAYETTTWAVPIKSATALPTDALTAIKPKTLRARFWTS